MTISEENVSWKGDIWIDDSWTAEDKAKAMEELHALEHQQHTNDKQQHQQRQEVFDQFRRNASTNWNSFYDKNQTNFFKDRHYLHKAFPAEFGWLYVDSNACEEDKNNRHQHHSILDNNITVAEIGCGVGNAILPLLEQHTELIHKKQTRSSSDDDNVRIPQLQIHCLDFAPTAIHLLKLDPRFQSAAKEGRATAHVYDLSSTHPSQVNLENTADVAILLFCLSAIGPHPSAALSRASRHVIDILKPGGTLVIRDYGRLDEAQMKLSRGEKKIDENFYRKGDGTGCYYFELQDLKDLFVNDQNGLELLELEYIQRVYRNRGDNSTRRRVWIQGRFRKPVATPKEKESIARPLSNGSIDTYSATAAVRWENYYKAFETSKSSPLRVPTNLFQIFPEFSPWQSLMKQQRRENHRRGNEQNIQPLYNDGGISDCLTISDCVTIVDLGCGLAANCSLLDLIYTLQKQHQQQTDEENKIPRVKVHFLDISATAIQQLCDDERYKSGLAKGSVASHVHDIRQPWALDESADKRFDLVLLLFTLSTIGPCNCDDMKQTVINAVNMLRQGGVLLFRDYGRYDDDQLQLNSIPGAQLHNNFYLREDSSTGCYFFDLDEVRELFVGAGLEVLQLEYTTRTYKKTGKSSKDLSKNGGAAERKRIFVDGRFRKP